MYTCESVGCSIFGMFFAHRYWLWPHHLHHCLYLGCCILNKQFQFHIHIAVSASIISCRICDVITYMLTSSGSGQEPPIVASSYRTVMSKPSLSTILRTQYLNNMLGLHPACCVQTSHKSKICKFQYLGTFYEASAIAFHK